MERLSSMNTPSDDAATDAFVPQLMEHRHRLYAFIAKQLVRLEDVEDIFQRTSLVFWRKIDQFDTAGSFFHWACGIAINEARNFLTVQRRSRRHFDAELVTLLAEEAKEEAEFSEARMQALRACMRRLSERRQEILTRCYGGTTSMTNVAASLGKERGAMYKQVARLREKLLDCIRVRLAQEGGG